MDQNEDDAAKSVENKIEKIKNKLKELQEQFNDPIEREKINLSDVLIITKYLATKLHTEHGHLFETFFISHLRILTKLLNDKPQKCVEEFERITKLMCELCANIGPRTISVDAGLCFWLQCLKIIPNDVKFDTFCALGNEQFGHCIDFLINAHCLLSQFQMLNILCSYVKMATDPLEHLWSLFKDKLDHYTFDAIKMIEWSTDNGIPLASQIYMIEHINRMQTKLFEERLICSELIESIKFDDCNTITCEENDGRFYMNKLSKTIDILITYNAAPLLIHITAQKLKNVRIVDNKLHWVHEMRLEFKKSPNLCNEHADKRSNMNIRGEFVDVTFDTGFHRQLLLALLSEMFNITPETVRRPNDLDIKMKDDSDIEIIEHSIEPSIEEPQFDDDLMENDENDLMEIDLPIKSSMPVCQSTPKSTANIKTVSKSQPHSLPASSPKEKHKRPKEIFVKPQPPPSARTALAGNDSTEKRSSEIPSISFYGNKKGDQAKDLKKEASTSPASAAPSVPQRSRRASAQRAIGEIRKTMEQSQFEFEENANGEVVLKEKRPRRASQPKRTKRAKKPTEPPKWPELNIETKKSIDAKKRPKRLFSLDFDQNEFDADEMPSPKTPKVVKKKAENPPSPGELTPSSFRSSVNGDPSKQKHRIWENIMKINKGAHVKKDDNSINPNASFSYLRSMSKTKKSSRPVVTQADSTSPNTEQNDQIETPAEFNQVAIEDDNDEMDVDEGVDINSNNRKDAHSQNDQQSKHLKTELKKIERSVQRALTMVAIDENDDEGDDH